ncbi:MAG: nicotinate-nicotinamide nucleotide adenylyltransferase [Phycisphaerales bacterium]|nr:nicotinate-nicotinamide nucleotide adenylyltransferase [Phycisphaerales bacterium]
MPPQLSISPLRLPPGIRTLLLFGGSFDPPHFYHTLVPLSILNRLYGPAGHLVYIPAAQSPLKRAGPVAADHHRLAMLKLALEPPGRSSSIYSIWTDELDRAARAHSPRPSYTIDSLRRLRRIIRPSIKLRLLIGADQAAAFHLWKDHRAILRLAEPLILARDPITTVADLYQSLDDSAWTRAERAAWCTRMAPNVPMPAASTALRAAIASAPPRAADWARRPPLDVLHPAVARYIINHKLYGFSAGR